MKKTMFTTILASLVVAFAAQASTLDKQKRFIKNHADEVIEACTSSSYQGLSAEERQSLLKNEALSSFNDLANKAQDQMREDEGDPNLIITEESLQDHGITAHQVEVASKQLIMINDIIDGNGSCSFYNMNGDFLNSTSGSEDSEWTLDN